MRNLKYLLFLILFTGVVNAQIVTIPDANFKAKLLAASPMNQIATNTSNQYIKIDTNNDGEIQINEAIQVQSLNVSPSFLMPATISSITGISSFVNLQYLNCSNNNLTSLDNSALSLLNNLDCSTNQIASLNFNGLLNLYAVNCASNQVTTLDFTNNPQFYSLGCGNNNLLTSVFIKNGNYQDFLPGVLYNDLFMNCPNLTYICVDESELVVLQSQLNNPIINPNPALTINSYCSFVPGGSYNTISGNVKYDSNNNGCDATDVTKSYMKINVSNGATQNAIFTNYLGNYNYYTNSGNFVLTPDIEGATLFTATPTTTTIQFATSSGNNSTQDFCISAVGIQPDLEVIIVPLNKARPGVTANYKLVYKNKGNQSLSGSVILNYEDPVLNFISATPTPIAISSGQLKWDYNNLLPFESRSVLFELSVNTSFQNPPVTIGDILTFNVEVNPVAADVLPLDNFFNLNQIIEQEDYPIYYSCLDGQIVSPTKIGDYLHYNINFENIGTTAATFVVVKNIVDASKFDINSLQIMESSHLLNTRINGNVVEFIFENINLSSSQRGNLVFKIKTKNNLVSGDTVSQKAEIFFDYNFPISTNTESSLFQSLTNSQFVNELSLVAVPNPTDGNFTVITDEIIELIELYDIQGRLIEIFKETNDTISISYKSNGVYFLKLSTENGIKTIKIIKK